MRTGRFGLLKAGQRRFACPLLFAALLASHGSTAMALDLTAGSGAARECSGKAPTFHAAAITYLEPAPTSSIDEYGGARYAPDHANNIGVGVGFAELSAAAGAYCFGLFYREEAEGVATGDLLDILHADHFGKPFDAGREYQLHYDWRMLEGLRHAPATRIRRRRNSLHAIHVSARCIAPQAAGGQAGGAQAVR
ncbi:MAG: hypothetical protein WDO56_19190 [Gammaproteobacteria bacterium]